MRQSTEKTIDLFCHNGQHDWVRTVKRLSANQPVDCPDHAETTPRYGPGGKLMEDVIADMEPSGPPLFMPKECKDDSHAPVSMSDADDLISRVKAGKAREQLLIIRLTAQERQDVVDLLESQPEAKFHKIATRM